MSLATRLVAAFTRTDAALLHAIRSLEITMSTQLDALKAQVAQNTVVTQSAVALIAGIADRITAAKSQDDDGAALDALTAELKGDADALAAAVAANTPAQAAPAPAPTSTDTTSAPAPLEQQADPTAAYTG